MAQEAEHDTTEETTDETTEGTTPEEKVYPEAHVRTLRGEAANYRRQLREAQEKLEALESAGKSDLEKLAERAASAEKAAEKAAADAARLEVAISKGLTKAQAKRLVGSTVEELEADADDLLASFGAGDGNKEDEQDSASGTPRERLRSGAVPAAEPDEMDPEKLADSIKRPFTI